MGRRAGDYPYELTQRLNAAVRSLREAEDMSRLERPALPTADRIRTIYEQISEDVLNGRVNVPPIAQRLREAEAQRDELARKLGIVERAFDRIIGLSDGPFDPSRRYFSEAHIIALEARDDLRRVALSPNRDRQING